MKDSPLAARLSKGAGAALAIALVSSHAAASESIPMAMRSMITWKGGDGPWSDMWLLPPEPFINDPVQIWIDGNNPLHSTVFLDVDVHIAGLTIDPGDALHYLSGKSLTLGEATPGYLANAGVFRIHASETVSRLIIGGGLLSIAGTGAVELDHSFNSRIVAIAGQNATCINASTIRGAGIIGDGQVRLVNYGLISADLPLELLQIQPDANPVQNDGVMQASNAGALVLLPGTYQNYAGHIVAHDDSYIDIDGATIVGGTLTALDDGIVRAHFDGAHLSDLTVNGRVELGLVRLNVGGQIINNGQIDFVPEGMIMPGNYTEVLLPAGAGDVTLAGAGELRLDSTKVFSDAAIPPRLINAPDHTIRGDGLLGYNTVALANFGTIIADHDDPLVIKPPPAPAPQTVNEGTLRAIGLGGFVITGGTFRNNGTIEVLPGSRCFYTATAVEANVADSTLAGGTWRVIAADQVAFILIPAPSVFFNTADVTLSGPGASFSIIDALLVNAGRFAIDNGRNFTTQGAFFSNEGELIIGHSSTFTASGTFSQADNAALGLHVSAENLTAQDAKLHTAGVATLGGSLRLTLADGFDLTPGDELYLVSAPAIVGEFSSIIVPPGVRIRYEPGAVIADVIAVCIGDLTGDGTVAAPDLTAMIAQWGACPQGCAADLTADGTVDVADMLMLIDAWGVCR